MSESFSHKYEQITFPDPDPLESEEISKFIKDFIESQLALSPDPLKLYEVFTPGQIGAVSVIPRTVVDGYVVKIERTEGPPFELAIQKYDDQKYKFSVGSRNILIPTDQLQGFFTAIEDAQILQRQKKLAELEREIQEKFTRENLDQKTVGVLNVLKQKSQLNLQTYLGVMSRYQKKYLFTHVNSDPSSVTITYEYTSSPGKIDEGFMNIPVQPRSEIENTYAEQRDVIREVLGYIGGEKELIENFVYTLRNMVNRNILIKDMKMQGRDILCFDFAGRAFLIEANKKYGTYEQLAGG